MEKGKKKPIKVAKINESDIDEESRKTKGQDFQEG